MKNDICKLTASSNRLGWRKISMFAAASMVAICANFFPPPSNANPIDPSIIPPEVTIPIAVPQQTAPATPPGQANGAPGLNNGQQGMPNGPIMDRRGMMMNNSGIPGLAGSNATPPGQPVANPNQPNQGNNFRNPYSGMQMPTDPNNPQGLQSLMQMYNQSANRGQQVPGMTNQGAQSAPGANTGTPPGMNTGAPQGQPSGTPPGELPLTQDGLPCYGCATHESNQSSDGTIMMNGKPVPISTGVTKPDPLAIIQTTKGPITIRLFRSLAPQTVANFMDLANKGFYNGLTWHRVVPGFVVQTGCPKGDGSGSYIDPATNQIRYIPIELNPQLRHNSPGVVAMARFGNNLNSASSQFYITLSSQPHLDSKYAVFGGVVSGMDSVYRITTADKVISVAIQGQ